jgi:ribosomal protein RSM22 (predicted rRNA methylase)
MVLSRLVRGLKTVSQLGFDTILQAEMLAVIPTENLEVRWQKSFKESDKMLGIEAPKTIALSAFLLTTLPTAVAQKTLVEEIWASGAHTLVLIDHDTPEGFKAIAHAREHLLELSKLEAENPELASGQPAGCHCASEFLP